MFCPAVFQAGWETRGHPTPEPCPNAAPGHGQLLLSIPTHRMTVATTEARKELTPHGSAVLPWAASLPNGLAMAFSLLHLASQKLLCSEQGRRCLCAGRHARRRQGDPRTQRVLANGCHRGGSPTSSIASPSSPKTVPITHLPPALRSEARGPQHPPLPTQYVSACGEAPTHSS